VLLAPQFFPQTFFEWLQDLASHTLGLESRMIRRPPPRHVVSLLLEYEEYSPPTSQLKDVGRFDNERNDALSQNFDCGFTTVETLH
jgi:hypothetical protein